MRILVAEDDREYRDVLTETLKGCGHTILAAADGLEALRILRDTAVDLIISDIQMPNHSGSQLHEKVRSNKKTKNIPFIYITGFSILRLTTPMDLTGLDFMTSKVPFDRLLQLIEDINLQKGILRNSDLALGTA
jgi:CheY-like chemotaxis protein